MPDMSRRCPKLEGYGLYDSGLRIDFQDTEQIKITNQRIIDTCLECSLPNCIMEQVGRK